MRALDPGEKGTLIAVAAIILAGGVVGIVLGRADSPAQAAPGTAAPAPVLATPSSVAIRTPQTTALSAAANPALESPADSELQRLGEESMSGPAALRVAAIERLATVPREQALPLLKRVLLNGDPGVDRPAALASLRALALSQGDGDGRIRDAMREVIYHGADDGFATSAQQTLDAIASSDANGR